MSDVYYEPEKFGLEKVSEWDFSDGNYQFDLRVIWRKSNGDLVTARDSGCSCPSPFEGVSLSELISASAEELKEEAIAESKVEYYHGDSLSDILEKIRALK